MNVYNDYYKNLTFYEISNGLKNICLNLRKFKNVPKTIDARFLNYMLYTSGEFCYFHDKYIGDICLPFISDGNFDNYGNPISWQAYSYYNNYHKKLTNNDSVIIYNNYVRTTLKSLVTVYAYRLYMIQLTHDINLKTQRTPFIIETDDKQKPSLERLFSQYDNFKETIFSTKQLSKNSISVFNLNTNYLCSELINLYKNTFNEFLVRVGIDTAYHEKKERMTADEINANFSFASLQRASLINPIKEGLEKVRSMFNCDIDVEFNDDVLTLTGVPKQNKQPIEKEVESNE